MRGKLEKIKVKCFWVIILYIHKITQYLWNIIINYCTKVSGKLHKKIISSYIHYMILNSVQNKPPQNTKKKCINKYIPIAYLICAYKWKIIFIRTLYTWLSSKYHIQHWLGTIYSFRRHEYDKSVNLIFLKRI